MDHRGKFIFLVVFEIPAVFLSFILFIYFFFNRPIYSKLKNHGWIILLTLNFLQLTFHLPMPMSYYYINYISPQKSTYCVWWTWCEYTLNITELFLMAWISIERHLVVFHAHSVFQVRWKRWIFHFIPIIFCLIWAPLFYLVLIVISPLCTSKWDFTLLLCGFPCYYQVKVLYQFDVVFNIILPVASITLANVTLVIRAIYQKISRRQAVDWRRHRKMVLQLWIVSSLYMGIWLPLAITLFVEMTFEPSFMVNQRETMQFVLHVVPLLLPLICLSTQPELVSKIKDHIRMRLVNTVGAVAHNRNPGQITTNTSTQ